jgi:probable rRNA maturation factor
VNDHPPSPQTRRRQSDAGSISASISVADEQVGAGSLPVDAARWTTLITAVVETCAPDRSVEVSVVFVDQARMADLNAEHMGHEGPTDVLAFPLDELGEPLHPDAPSVLGDIVVCPAVAARNAATHAGTYDDEIALLLVHGLLHLLGMDHADEPARVGMQQRERELLTAHFGALARDPWT